MTTPSSQPDPGDTDPVVPTRRSPGGPPKAPRWVKVSAIVLALLVLLVVAMKVAGIGGSGHGPGRHTGAAPFSVTATGAPAGHSAEPARK